MTETKIKGTTAFVTGANRGIGRAITEALLERGADKVYAAAETAGNVSILANNAGVASGQDLFPTYSASKAAAHSLTQGARALLKDKGVAVHGVYPGPVDTDRARELPFDKASPREVASAILDGIESGREEIFPDAFAEQFGQRFQSCPKAAEQQVAAMLSSDNDT